MNFYTVKKLSNNLTIESSSIDVVKMVESFKLVEKKSNKKTVDDLMNYCFVFLEDNVSFSKSEPIEIEFKNKKITFGLIKENQIFKLEDTSNPKITYEYFTIIHEGKLKTFSDKNILIEKIEKSPTLASNSVEEKALEWLNSGRVGLSSATICATLFPNLIKHHRFNNMKNHEGTVEINWPHDNGDFIRCMKFFEEVPEAKEKLEELRTLSSQWNNLVSNWLLIEELIENDKTEESYVLIKKSLENHAVMKLK